MSVKRIGVLTSGGDAPGMNAAIRAVTRAAIANDFRVMAIYRGYEGLINDEIKEFTTENVSNIIQRGGTILKTARSKEFQTPEGRQKAFDNMQKRGIDALVVIGGNGSLSGARIFAQEFDIPCIGLPGTIDNDLKMVDRTIREYYGMEMEDAYLVSVISYDDHGNVILEQSQYNGGGFTMLEYTYEPFEVTN